MPFEPFNLGDVLQNAQAIKGMQDNATMQKLQQQYLGQRMTQDAAQEQRAVEQAGRDKTQFDEQQQLTNTKLLNMAAAEVSQNPAAASRWDPILKSAIPGWEGVQGDPAHIQAGAKALFESTSKALQAYQTGGTPQFGTPYKDASGATLQTGPNGEVRQVVAPHLPTIPAGYEPDPAKPGALRPTPGGPADKPAATLDPDSLDLAATVVAANPARIRDYASFGANGQAIRSAINERVTQRLKDAGMTANDLIQLRARAAAQPANLAKLTQQNAQIQQAEQLARANGQRLLDLIDLVDQTGVPLIEGISRSARAKAGNVDAAELKSVLNSFQIETARLLSGNPSMAGVISDSARNDIQHIAPDSMSAAQAKRIVNRLFTEMDIRQAAAQEQMNTATQGTTVLPPAGGVPSQAAPQAAPIPQPQQPQQNGPVQVQSEAQYNSLPSGTQYLAPDGTTRTKR